MIIDYTGEPVFCNIKKLWYPATLRLHGKFEFLQRGLISPATRNLSARKQR